MEKRIVKLFIFVGLTKYGKSYIEIILCCGQELILLSISVLSCNGGGNANPSAGTVLQSKISEFF